MDPTIHIGVCIGRSIRNQTGHKQTPHKYWLSKAKHLYKKIGFSLPNIDNILDKLGHLTYITALDLQINFH